MDPERIDPSNAPAPEPSRQGRAAQTVNRRAFLRLLGLGAAGVAFVGGLVGAYRFEVEPIARVLPGLQRPLRVAWLTDLHYGPFIRCGSIAAWVDATLALEPELIVLGGDIVDNRVEDDLAPLLAQLERLRAPLGVYAIWGNHEHDRFDDLRPFERSLSEAGVTVLANRGVQLRDDLHLVGIDDGPTSWTRMNSALVDAPPERGCLLAVHSPAALPHVPRTVGLSLCGHTHGGQVVLPGIGPVLSRSGLGRGFDAGWIQAPGLAYVSRGLGVSHLPIRINCPAELTIATLTAA